MEKQIFWALFAIALIAGLSLGIAYTNSTITGSAITQVTDQPEQTYWQKLFGAGAQVTPENIIACTDNDGGYNIYVKGTCYDYTGETFTDYCIGDNNIAEYFCSNNRCTIQQWAHPCPEGYICYNGACVKEEQVNISNATTILNNIYIQNLQKVSLTEAYERFRNNIPKTLQQEIEERNIPGPIYPIIYPIGCIDYEDMDGEWEIFKDNQGYWRARYLGPYPTQIKPYYVLDIGGGYGSPVEVWPDDLQYEVYFLVDGCETNIYYGPTCYHYEAYCINNSHSSTAAVYCTGNCSGNFTQGFSGCYGSLFIGKCIYPWRSDFGTYENPLIS